MVSPLRSLQFSDGVDYTTPTSQMDPEKRAFLTNAMQSMTEDVVARHLLAPEGGLHFDAKGVCAQVRRAEHKIHRIVVILVPIRI